MLWVAFAAVHSFVAVLGFVLPNEPMGDLDKVYDPWSRAVLDGGWIMGVHESWVYPQLALVPLVVVQLVAQPFALLLPAAGAFAVAWAIVVTVADALAFALLVGRARSTGRRRAAWYWLAFVALLGPIAMYRVDAVTVPLAVAGCLWLIGRPWLGGALLAVATWIKVWPAALVAAALVTLRRRWAVLGAGAAVTAAVVLAVAAAGGLGHLLGFVGGQTGRGLQIEAPVSAMFLWPAALGAPGVAAYYDTGLLTYQVSGPGVDAVSAAMTPLLVTAVVGILVVAVVKRVRAASFVALFPALSLALVMALIVVNKVGSPQFYLWIVVPLIAGLVLDRDRWWATGVLGLVVAALTQLVYPVVYAGLAVMPNPAIVAVLVLTIRNLAAIALFVWSLVLLARVRTRRAVPVAV